MSYTFKKVTTKTWEVVAVYKNYLPYKTFKTTGIERPKCEICNAKFEEDGFVNLAFVKGRKNHLICTKCTEEAEANGVEMQYKRSEEPQLPKFD